MPQYQQPTELPSWTNGSASQIAAPTPSQRASGFTSGQRPTFGLVNYLFYHLSAWIRFLQQGINAVLVGAFQEPDFRLLNGGVWSWNAATNTLSWSSAFQIQMAGLSDSANNAAAGSVVLNAGQVAYVASNTPFSTTGDVANGDAVVRNLAYESGITVGLSVTGPGIAPNTTVQSVSQTDNSLTLSNPATADNSKAQLVFATSGALTVQAADIASFAPSASTVVVARCLAGTPNQVHVGVNASYMRLLDGEAKALLGNGYVSTMRATAGAALSARQPVYLSPGSADSRTAGAAYPLDVSTAGTPTRAAFAGFAATATASGAVAEIVMAGKLPGFTALVPGQTYYASPSAPTSLQATKPATNGQYIVPVGAAVAADTLAIAPSPSPVVQAVGATTAFSGPISAPSVISGVGFKSSYFVGTLGGSRTTNRRIFSLAFFDSVGGFVLRDAVFIAASSGVLRGATFNLDNIAAGATVEFQLIKNGAFTTFGVRNEDTATLIFSALVPFAPGDRFALALVSGGTLGSTPLYATGALQISYDA